MFHTSPENTRIVVTLENYICENSMTDQAIINYQELNKVAGVNVQRKRRDLLQAAIKKAQKRLRCIFGTVRSIGIKRLHADETHNVSRAHRRHVKRTTNRKIKLVMGVNSNQMSGDSRQLVDGELALLNLIANVAATPTKKMPSPATADPYAAKKAMEEV